MATLPCREPSRSGNSGAPGGRRRRAGDIVAAPAVPQARARLTSGMARTYRLERRQLVERPLDEVFAFFADATNLEAITPGFLRFSIRTPLPIAMGEGTRIEYTLRLFGLPLRWRTLISVWEVRRRFVDEQVSGPYAGWRHTHTFEAVEGGTLVTDVVDYALPFGLLGRLAHALFIGRTLDRIFAHRHEAITRLLPADATTAPRPALRTASARRARPVGRLPAG